jgi:ankyrin repeat protein
VIKLLLAAGAPIPRTIMFHSETPVEVQLFLDAGADLEAKNGEGETPLLAANDEEVAIALLEAGADRNAKDEDGKTIIDKAANKDAGMPRVFACCARTRRKCAERANTVTELVLPGQLSTPLLTFRGRRLRADPSEVRFRAKGQCLLAGLV